MNKNHQIYINKLLSLVDVGLIKSKHYRVLVDPANGAASEVLVELIRRCGCRVIKINCEMDKLPKRAPEPRAKTLTATAKVVKDSDCDLGIATDMDADRVLFIDEKGKVLSEDLAGAILGKAELKQGGGVLVTPVNSSGIFREVIEANGGRVVESRIGPPEISKKIVEVRAVFGYEESGKYFFAKNFIWADGLLAGIKMLNVMAENDKPLSQIRRQYPVYYQEKLAVDCPREKMPRRWVGEGEKRVFGDSFMFIRASGTEPLIRIFSDGKDLKTVKRLALMGKQAVSGILGL